MKRALAMPWLVFAFVECGCSESRQTVLASRGGACAPSCDGGTPGDSGTAVPESQVTLGECFGEGLDCESEVEVTPYEAGPLIQCAPIYRGQGTISWTYLLDGFACPDPCWVPYAKVDFGADGNIDVLGTLRLQNPYATGLWSGRIDPSGTLLESSVLEVRVGSSLSLFRTFSAIGTDAQGNRLAFGLTSDRTAGTGASAPGLTDYFDIQVLRYDRAGNPAQVLESVARVSFPQAKIAPDGGFALTLNWPFVIQEPYDDPMRIDVARYDARGRLLWNQTKLSRLLELNYGFLVGFDAAGNLAMHVYDEYVGSGSSGFIAVFERLAWVAPTGNVVRAWDGPEPGTSNGATWAVAPDGSAYAVRRPLRRDGDLQVEEAPVLERVDPSGRSAWIIELPVEEQPGLIVDAQGNAIIVMQKPELDGSRVEFMVIHPDGQVCETFDVRCDTWPTGEPLCPPSPDDVTENLKVGSDGSLYFVTKEAENPLYTVFNPGPARIGRVTRPE